MTQPSNPRRRFIAGTTALVGSTALGLPRAFAQKSGAPEKEVLKFGFIKLTDCAPLVVAYEKHFFEDEGLNVTLEAQANWKVLLDRVIDGQHAIGTFHHGKVNADAQEFGINALQPGLAFVGAPGLGDVG